MPGTLSIKDGMDREAVLGPPSQMHCSEHTEQMQEQMS